MFIPRNNVTQDTQMHMHANSKNFLLLEATFPFVLCIFVQPEQLKIAMNELFKLLI